MHSRVNSQALSLYLHGTAGIGKSSFVLNFCKAFDLVINKYLEPGCVRQSVVCFASAAAEPKEPEPCFRFRGQRFW
jgi:hypothetical protein